MKFTKYLDLMCLKGLTNFTCPLHSFAFHFHTYNHTLYYVYILFASTQNENIQTKKKNEYCYGLGTGRYFIDIQWHHYTSTSLPLLIQIE